MLSVVETGFRPIFPLPSLPLENICNTTVTVTLSLLQCLPVSELKTKSVLWLTWMLECAYSVSYYLFNLPFPLSSVSFLWMEHIRHTPCLVTLNLNFLLTAVLFFYIHRELTSSLVSFRSSPKPHSHWDISPSQLSFHFARVWFSPSFFSLVLITG